MCKKSSNFAADFGVKYHKCCWKNEKIIICCDLLF